MPDRGDPKPRRPVRWLAPLAALGVAGGVAMSVQAVGLDRLGVQAQASLTAWRTPAAQRVWTDSQGVRADRVAVLRDLFATAPHHGMDDIWSPQVDALVDGPQNQAETGLTALLGDFAQTLRTPSPDATPLFVDPALMPAQADLSAVETASDAEAFRVALRDIGRLNPLYDDLRRAAGPAPDAVTQANLDRLRSLPADLGDRHVVVDTAGAQLWLYEGGRVVDHMRAVVGQPRYATPAIVGRLHHTVLQPYWNIPEDLARDRFAPQAAARGGGVIDAAGIKALSDWTPTATPISTRAVDWRAVADGRVSQRLRQDPGPANMMGVAKFMLPNDRGIYLHDTPSKDDFVRSNRALSAGCVRVEDAERLFAWLHGDTRARLSDGRPEQSVALTAPVPVYILHMTARVEDGRIVRARDVYGRDPQTGRTV